jgi:hypothetical protein
MSRPIITEYPVKRYRQFKNNGSGSRYLLLRVALVEKYGVCYWCNVPVKEYHQDGQSLPDDAATIDHLKPRQFRKRFEITEKVLACNKCNREHNEAVQRGENWLSQQDTRSTQTPSKSDQENAMGGTEL